MRRLSAALLLLAACGKETPRGSGPAETAAYHAWKGGQALRTLPAAAFGENIAVTVTVHFPQSRSRGPQDFVELYVNGQHTQRTAGKPAGGGAVVPTTVTLSVPAGPVWLDLWDSTMDRNHRQQIDTRQGKDYTFVPTGSGYDLSWTPREN